MTVVHSPVVMGTGTRCLCCIALVQPRRPQVPCPTPALLGLPAEAVSTLMTRVCSYPELPGQLL